MAAILDYLDENSEGTVTDFETLLGVKSSRVKNILYELMHDDKIKAVGEKKNRSYRLKKDEDR